MLTMTVMQHEREGVGQLSTEAADAEDVLSRLRHLHHTLQECHWRVQLVDHALCAQGDKGHHGPQDEIGNDHIFEIQARKDCRPQKQTEENHNLQFEIEKDRSPQNEAGEDQDFEEQFRETLDYREQIENDDLQKEHEKDQNYQDGNREESENQFCEDYCHQKPAEEKHSLLTKEQKLSVQAEDDNIHDLYSGTEKDLFDHTRDDSDLSDLAKNDCIPRNYAKNIRYETREDNNIQNSIKNTCELDSTDLLGKKCNKYLTEQEYMNIDDDHTLPTSTIDTVSATMEPPHVSEDPNVDEISPVPSTMTDISEQHHQLMNLNMKLSKKISKQESSQESHPIGEVRYRSESLQNLGNKFFYKGDMNFFKDQKKGGASQDHQENSKEMEYAKDAGKVSPEDSSPEVAQRMNVIWETLENLRSHFLALHSSLVNSSNLLCSQELAEKLDNSYITIKENDKVAECGELHAVPEDHHTKEFPQTASETTQLHQALCEQTFQRKFPVKKYPHFVCHSLSRNQVSSHTPLEEPDNSAALTDNSTHTRTCLRSWRESCLGMVVIVLLLLLFLFLASCLLLILPVVSVSVRTAGGLPAF